MNTRPKIGKNFFPFLFTVLTFFAVVQFLGYGFEKADVSGLQKVVGAITHTVEKNAQEKSYLEAGQFAFAKVGEEGSESVGLFDNEPTNIYAPEELSKRTTRNMYLIASFLGFLGILLMGGVADLLVQFSKKAFHYFSHGPFGARKINSDFL